MSIVITHTHPTGWRVHKAYLTSAVIIGFRRGCILAPQSSAVKWVTESLGPAVDEILEQEILAWQRMECEEEAKER